MCSVQYHWRMGILYGNASFTRHTRVEILVGGKKPVCVNMRTNVCLHGWEFSLRLLMGEDPLECDLVIKWSDIKCSDARETERERETGFEEYAAKWERTEWQWRRRRKSIEADSQKWGEQWIDPLAKSEMRSKGRGGRIGEEVKGRVSERLRLSCCFLHSRLVLLYPFSQQG